MKKLMHFFSGNRTAKNPYKRKLGAVLDFVENLGGIMKISITALILLLFAADYYTIYDLFREPQFNFNPLIQKILQVPEYMETYQKYLLEFSNEESAFYVENSQERIRNWQKMIEPYIKSDKIDYEASSTYDEFDDFPATWGATPIYRLLSGNENKNFFMAKSASIKRAIESYNK